MTSQETKNSLMPTRLTLARDGCDRETGRGQQHVGTRRHPGRNHCMLSGRQGKTCMVNAKLRETQIRDFIPGHDAAMVDASCCAKGGAPQKAHLNLVAQPTSRRGANDRTGHLTTSHLIDRVNTGSPKRAPLRCPVGRRSCHISQTPGVMPGTAIHGWTGMGETGRATGWGIPSARVKGGALAGSNNFITEVC